MNNKYNKTSNYNIFNPRRELKLATKLKPHLLKFEIVVIIIAGIGYLLKTNEIIAGTAWLLSGAYFFMYFVKYKREIKISEATFNIFLFVISWSRVLCISVVFFTLTNLADNQTIITILSIGISLLTVSLLVILYSIIKGYKDELFSFVNFTRNLIILSVSVAFYFFMLH